MCETYSRWLLRVSVAQICQALGWDSVQVSACDLLTDVLQRYLQGLGRGCHRYCELYGRTDPILDDVGDAFKLMGVNLHELEDYIHNIEPVTFAHQIPSFPVSKNNVLQFPQPGSKDAEERKEYIPDYLPPIVSSQEVNVLRVCFGRKKNTNKFVVCKNARQRGLYFPERVKQNNTIPQIFISFKILERTELCSVVSLILFGEVRSQRLKYIQKFCLV